MEFPPPPERSKRLHNFTLPYLRWGEQRFLRCVKLPSSPDHRSPAVDGGGEFGDGKLRLDPPKVSTLGNGGGDAARPWNLRTRRAACNEPGDEEPTGVVVKRGGGSHEGDSSPQKLKFSVSLLRQEIEDDFTALVGKKPPRRPKKRPRPVQKQMNTLFPGLWLAEEVTACSYDVPEAAAET
ncbi:hypothetical protein F2Q70_00037024 [Brassica cretica]|uniref:DUF1639 domain-containing protein n=1 Tax=Brassica cretica TaxID=69181 RepID=A0A8S9JYJ3_BRACR|nr:hypothetical protein F2Q70_00037024 [Brassica cretica]